MLSKLINFLLFGVKSSSACCCTRKYASEFCKDFLMWHPGLEKPERPVFHPRDRGEVFWNTALLSIEQTSSLLQHEYEYKGSDITMNNINTVSLPQPRLLYTCSTTTRNSGTTNGDDGLQSAWTLAGTFILARENSNNTNKQAIHA